MSNRTEVKVGSSLWAMLMSLLLIMLCSCTHTWDYPPLEPNEHYQNVAHKYYVIDANVDIPDASFETLKEASVYQKEFAEYHDYVIVKIDERYKVYNMEIISK